MSTAIAVLDPNFGYVLVAPVGFVAVNMFHMMSVTAARNKHGVSAPLIYAPPDHPECDTFNCVQRAHQNYLEQAPFAMFATLVAGFAHPVEASILALVWLCMRVGFALAYTKSSSLRRPFMMLSMMALFVMLGYSVSAGLQVAGVI